jgi:hypothetical protein
MGEEQHQGAEVAVPFEYQMTAQDLENEICALKQMLKCLEDVESEPPVSVAQ